MKNKRFLFAILILLVFLFAACTNRSLSPSPVPTLTATPSAPASPTLTSTPSPTATPTPTVSPTPTKTPKELILGNFENEDQNAVYYNKKISLEKTSEVCLMKFSDSLAVAYQPEFDAESDMSYCIDAYDPYTFTKTGSIGLSSLDLSKQIIRGGDRYVILVTSEYVGGGYEVEKSDYDFYLYDTKLNEIDHFTITEFGYISDIIYDETKDRIFFDDGKLGVYEYDLKTGEVNTVAEFKGEEYEMVYSVEMMDAGTLIANVGVCINDDYDTRTFFINTDTGAITAKETTVSCSSKSEPGGKRSILSLHDNCMLLITDKDKDSDIMVDITSSGEAYSFFPDWKNNVVVTLNSLTDSNDSIKELRCYSMETGKIISDSCILAEKYDFATPELDAGNGLLYLTGVVENEEHDYDLALFAWDYLNDAVESKEGVYSRRSNISVKFSGKVEALRREIEEKYKVFVYLGYEILDVDFLYDTTPCNDEDKILTALNIIKKAMEQYPEDFFDQLKSGEMRTLGIYLCDGIVRRDDDSNSVDNAIGLAKTIEYERSLMIDVNYTDDLEATFYHEISHWIDRFIGDMQNLGRCSEFEEGFGSLNPIEGYYADSYADYYNRREYTYYYEGSSGRYDNIYSVDSYGRTYQTEDRARLFENLMVPGKDLYRCRHILEKYDYFFNYIRICFDTANWPGKTTWEKKLDEWIEQYEREYGHFERFKTTSSGKIKRYN